MPDVVPESPEFVPVDEARLETADRAEIMGALFESFVTQQGSLGLSLMGELPPDAGGGIAPDLESAKLVIDQLEMFEFKTKGNLSAAEAAFLRKTITVLGEALMRRVESNGKA